MIGRYSLGLSLLVGAFVVSFYGFYIEPNRVVLSRVEIEIPDLVGNLTIVHISDLHLEGVGEKERKVVEMIEEIHPDLLVITGDFVSPGEKGLEGCIWMIKELRAKCEVFGVWGNVDHRLLSQEDKIKIKDAGIVILENSAKKVRENIWIVGIDDPVSRRDNLGKALRGVPEDSLKILLSHSPVIDEEAKKRGVNLVLAGHTHGGQIYIPLVSHLLLHLHRSKGYVRGLYKVDETYLYVNRGIGTTFLPLRMLSPPEITLLRLRGR